MATHSSILAWRIPWTEEPGGLQSRGRKVRHDWVSEQADEDTWASLVAQLVKNPHAMQETWVWALGWEDPLKKGKATHSSVLAWRIPWTIPWMAKSLTWWSDCHFTSLPFFWWWVVCSSACSTVGHCWAQGWWACLYGGTGQGGGFLSVLFLVFCLQLMDCIARDEKA